ncbi:MULTISPECIES: hypothetical protein [Burkholderia]|nr:MULTISPECIES: hypothetical protein [Burkholderia]
MTGPADRGSGFAAMKHSGIKMGAIGVAETSDYKLDRIRFRHRQSHALPLAGRFGRQFFTHSR